MKQSDSTRTKVYSYRAKWFHYRRVCKRVGMKPLDHDVRAQIDKEFDLLLQEEVLQGDKVQIFTGMGSLYIKGVYVQMKNPDGSPKIVIDNFATHYNPVYDEEGNKIPQYSIGEYWDYFLKWLRPVEKKYFEMFCEMNKSKFKHKRITPLKLIDSPILYKFKENNKRHGL